MNCKYSTGGIRRSNSSCASSSVSHYEPFMMGKSQGFGVNSTQMVPLPINICTINEPSPPAVRSSSLRRFNNQNENVRQCMYWPSSLSCQLNTPSHPKCSHPPQQEMGSYLGKSNSALPGVSGDYHRHQYCSAPPKVYLSTPGKEDIVQQNIPCQVAPLGTDPMSMIMPLDPLTVRVQAPSDIFAGNSSEPKTIPISPTQLYGNSTGGR